MSNLLISVVIPTCNRPADLGLCLDLLAPGSQALDSSLYEVIVTDDGSESVEVMLAERYPWVRYVRGPQRGPAANRNCGALVARGEWLAFTDDDCLPSAVWLTAFHQAILEGDHQVLEGRTIAHGKRTRVDMECPLNETGGQLWSCNFAINKTLFRAIGGFDEKFPGPAMEDVDLRIRLLKAGHNFPFITQALVEHPWRLRKGREHLRLAAESVAYFIAKHPEQELSFSTMNRCKGLAREFLKRVPAKVSTAGCKGLFRDSILTLMSQLELTREFFKHR